MAANLSTNMEHHTVLSKKALRKTITSTLNQLSPSEVDKQSQEIYSRLASLPSFANAKSISCFLNMPSGEVETSYIVKEILRSGKTLFVPKIMPEHGTMRFLRIYNEEDLDSLIPGKWGIREPTEQWGSQSEERFDALDPIAEPLDVIIMPGLAFDVAFHRLGHGKGYYDKYLTAYQEAKHQTPKLIAPILREQLLDNPSSIPVLDHDWLVDILITPDQEVHREEDTYS